jgi:hypothetical protein
VHTADPRIPVLSVAGCSARPCGACQPRKDMILVKFTCELRCTTPVREISVTARLARPGCSVELFEVTAGAGGREVARAPAWPGRRTVASRRSPGSPVPPGLPDESSAPSRPARADGYLTAIEWRGVGDFTTSLSFGVTLLTDETSRQDLQGFVRSGVTDPLETP